MVVKSRCLEKQEKTVGGVEKKNIKKDRYEVARRKGRSGYEVVMKRKNSYAADPGSLKCLERIVCDGWVTS